MTIHDNMKDSKTPWNAGLKLSKKYSKKPTGWQKQSNRIGTVSIPLNADPDAWKAEWKPLDVNGKYAHLKCNGISSYVSMHTASNKTNEQLDIEAGIGEDDLTDIARNMPTGGDGDLTDD